MKYSEFLELVKESFELHPTCLCEHAIRIYHMYNVYEHYRHYSDELKKMLKGYTYITEEGNIPEQAQRHYRLYIINRMIGSAKLAEDNYGCQE